MPDNKSEAIDVIDPRNLTAEGLAHRILEVCSDQLLNKQTVLSNDKRRVLEALKIEDFDNKEKCVRAKVLAPTRRGDASSHIEVIINFTPRTMEEWGGAASRMLSIVEASDLLHASGQDLWAMQLMFNVAYFLEQITGYVFDRSHQPEWNKFIKGAKRGTWDHETGFFGYVPTGEDEKFIEVIMTRHRVFYNPDFRAP